MAYSHNKRWRKKHPDKRYRSKLLYHQRMRDKPANQRNARQLWTLEQIELILADDRPPDSILASRIGRSVQAIQMKRVMLRKTVTPKPKSSLDDHDDSCA